MIQKLPSLVNNTDEVFGKPGKNQLSIVEIYIWSRGSDDNFSW